MTSSSAPDPVRPFGRSSTLEDIATTPIGKVLLSVVEREGLKRARREFPDPDDATVNMLRSALREGPLRLLVTMGGGAVSFAVIDGVIDVLNRQWSSLPGRLRKASEGLRR